MSPVQAFRDFLPPLLEGNCLLNKQFLKPKLFPNKDYLYPGVKLMLKYDGIAAYEASVAIKALSSESTGWA